MQKQTGGIESPPECGDGYSDVGTLGDDLEHASLTCSYDACKAWGRATGIRPFPTFEAAVQALKLEEVSAVVVAAAYPRLPALIFDSALTVREVFTHRIPPMVLAGVGVSSPAEAVRLYHHPATTPLLGEVPVHFGETVPVTSNSMACSALIQDSSPAVAITNALCAAFFKLAVYRVLRVGVNMPFIVFCRSV